MDDSKVDESGNRFVLFDEIVDHRTNGSEIKDENAFIISKNGGKDVRRQPRDKNCY